MRKLLLCLLFLSILIFPSWVHADPSTYLNLPPTNAFDKIHSDNGTISAVNFSMPLTVKGGSGISVQSSNASHTLTITNTATPNTHNGSYNTTQANNVNINSGGYKINFINGTGATVHLQNSGAGNQVNVTVSATGTSSGVTSLNALTGALTIACVSGNTTCTTSGGNTITVNTGNNLTYLSKFNNFTNHNIIIASGGTSPIFQIISNSSTNNLFMDSYGATTNIQVRRADGTISSPSALQSNDIIGGISARGYGATGFGTTAPGQVRFTASGGNWNDTSQPTAISFLTTSVGSITSVVGLIITSYQALRLSQIGDPSTVTANDLWKSSTNADVIKYRNNAGTSTYNILSTLSVVNATRGQLSGNGTGTSSATMVMDGVYATITPTNTGRVTVSVTGVSANSAAGDGCNIGIRQNTSNMGINGATVTGTILGDDLQSTSGTAGEKLPFSRIYDFSGPIGTKQFFDLSFSRVTGGTCTLTSINWDLVEH